MSYHKLEVLGLVTYNDNRLVWVIYPMDDVTAQEFIDDEYDCHDDLIDLVEEWGQAYGMICSEKELSDRFDDTMMEVLDHATYYRYKDDDCWINEEFSIFMDTLCSDGEIHSEQGIHKDTKLFNALR